jgi:hypothetical protein
MTECPIESDWVYFVNPKTFEMLRARGNALRCSDMSCQSQRLVVVSILANVVLDSLNHVFSPHMCQSSSLILVYTIFLYINHKFCEIKYYLTAHTIEIGLDLIVSSVLPQLSVGTGLPFFLNKASKSCISI